MTYDSATDSKLSWLEAIRAIRLQGLLDGRYEPANDKERQFVKNNKGVTMNPPIPTEAVKN